MFFSRDVQRLLGLTRTQVLHWSKECLAVPPASPPEGTGRHQQFTPRNVVDLAIARELLDHGLSTRRIRNILSLCQRDPYHEENQKAAIQRQQASFKGVPANLAARLSYDYLAISADRSQERRLVGRATGQGIRWWKEKAPKTFVHQFLSHKDLLDLARDRDSLTVVNVARLRRLVFEAIRQGR